MGVWPIESIIYKKRIFENDHFDNFFVSLRAHIEK